MDASLTLNDKLPICPLRYPTWSEIFKLAVILELAQPQNPTECDKYIQKWLHRSLNHNSAGFYLRPRTIQNTHGPEGKDGPSLFSLTPPYRCMLGPVGRVCF